MLDIRQIEEARTRIGDSVFFSPCAYSRVLSDRAGCAVHLKLENLQMTGSFKERGACNKLLCMTATERSRGVIAASAGNHAQGVAFHAARLGIDATIVMPETTPLVKVASTRRWGAKVVLHGANFEAAHAEARRIERRDGNVFVHAFDDDDVIAGQGTIGLELVEQCADLDAVVVAVGGGGLLAGVAIAIKARHPRIQVFGVESSAAASMQAALAAGAPTDVPPAETIADGIAVRQVGARPLEIASTHVDGLVSVDDEEIAESVLVLLEEEKTVAEGAGAAPLAAVLQSKLPLSGKRVAVVVCGGNIDVNLVARMIDRGLRRSGRLMRARVRLPDVPGALASLLAVLGRTGANVLEVHHDRVGAQVDLRQVVVELALETRGFSHISEVRKAMSAEGYVCS